MSEIIEWKRAFDWIKTVCMWFLFACMAVITCTYTLYNARYRDANTHTHPSIDRDRKNQRDTTNFRCAWKSPIQMKPSRWIVLRASLAKWNCMCNDLTKQLMCSVHSVNCIWIRFQIYSTAYISYTVHSTHKDTQSHNRLPTKCVYKMQLYRHRRQ